MQTYIVGGAVRDELLGRPNADRDYVVVDQELHRPAEVNILLGDASKARAQLGWNHSVTFEELVREMVEADCRALGVEHALVPRAGTARA